MRGARLTSDTNGYSLLVCSEAGTSIRGNIRQNNGIHLDGGMVDEKMYQARWREVMALSSQRYDVPSGRVGCLFIQAVVDELKGAVQRS